MKPTINIAIIKGGLYFFHPDHSWLRTPMARRLSLSGDFWGQGEALPSYDTAFTPQEFEAKAEAVAEQTRPQVSEGKSALFQDSGPSLGSNPKSAYHNEFEDWDDAKFEAAAAAYQQRRMQQQGAGSSTQPTASSSHSTLNT